MIPKEINNLTLLKDSNKGFENAISKDRIELAEIYLNDIVNRSIRLTEYLKDLGMLDLDRASQLQYKSAIEIDLQACLNIYFEYGDFLIELEDMVNNSMN